MEAPSAEWRSQIHTDARQRIVDKIMDTLRSHLPLGSPDGMNEVKKIAQRFEDKIFSAAVNQADYLRKISLKMLSIETKTQQNTSMNSQPGVSQNSADTGLLGGPPQVNNQGQPLSQIPMVSPSLGRRQILAQNLQNNTPATMQGSSTSPSIAGLSQPTLPNYGHTSNMQNMPGISHSSVNNSLAQGAATDNYGNAQRQLQGRQQQQSILSQQQLQNPLLYQNQLQSQLMKAKMPNNTHLQSMQQQQQHHSLLQANQIQPSQQYVMQIPSSLSSGQTSIQQSQVTSIQSAPEPSLRQNQLNSIQQSVTSLLPQHVQAIARQSQQPLSSINQQSSLQQQSAAIHQQSNLQPQQQQQLLGQQNNIVDIKQQQQQRLPVQQNNLVNLQHSQQLLNQQNLSLHQQQLSKQTKMQNLQQQQQPQSQQQQQQHQLLSSLQNVSNMQPHQRSMQLQQSKKMSQTQQQLQQPSMTLLQSQGQQTHLLSSQQQLMPQFQSQPGQLQQPLAVQQKPNSMQREMQQRLQISGSLLQSQTAMEQQKPIMQSQRGIPEVSSSTSIDSTTQTRHTVTDWQEEAYQKIQVMKEAYFAELHEFNLKISHKLQQPDAMPHAKQSESFEKFKSFKMMLDRMLAFLQIPKSNITHVMKEKLPNYEKQIVGMLSSNRIQKGAPSQQQGQQQVQQRGQQQVQQQVQQQGQQQFHHPVGLAQSTPQHHPSQVLQAQQQENHGNQVQQINMPGSLTIMQSEVASSMQHGAMALSSLAAPVTQQNVANSVQSASDLDSVPVNPFGSLHQGSLGSVQQNGLGSLQNSVSTAQQTNLNNLSQRSKSALQQNNTLQNSNVLQQQHLKQQPQEHLMQNQQLIQKLHQRQIQQQLLQQQKRQQLLQPQQQLHQQQKQQQPSQMSVHQMSELHPMNELKVRQGSSIKAGLYQQPYPVDQRQNLCHQQLKPGASFSISSPQNLQASSSQISHHSSPQTDQHALLPTLTRTGTPIQSSSSPFVDPSPSTPIALSPLPGDSEKLASPAVSRQSAGQSTHQLATSGQPQTQAISVATPGTSASPLLEEFTSQERNLPNSTVLSRTSASERPVERLIGAVQSLSPKALSSAASDITSVVSMIDWISGSTPGDGSRAAVGEDLVAMTKCRLQARNFMLQDGGATVKKMKRHTSAMPLNNASSAGSINENFMKRTSLDSSEIESMATSRVKRQKLEVNHALKEEIRETNQKLIDTVVSICDEDSDSVAALSEGGEGVIVKCSFSPAAFSPILKAKLASMHMSPIAPLRLLVPANYPKSSPRPLDNLPLEPSKEIGDLYFKARSSFSVLLRSLSQPISLGEMAKKWDACARKVTVEYAHQIGGCSFSSTYGAWENSVGA